jgi:hypothetical protein
MSKIVEVVFDQRIGMVLCTVREKGKKAPMGDAFAKTRDEAQARALNIANVSNYGDGSGEIRRAGKSRATSEAVIIRGAIPLYS